MARRIHCHPSLALALTAALHCVEPPPALTVSQWADQNRVLSPEASAEPGRWRTDRIEPSRGIMDSVNEPGTYKTVVMASSQVCKTECALNVIGYRIDRDPTSILAVFPTGKSGDAEKWSKKRFGPMVRDTPCLRDKVAAARAKDASSTILYKTFPGGDLTAVGSNAPGQLAANPAGAAVGEEIDRWPRNAGGEGDVGELIDRRTATYPFRKLFFTSSPTLKGTSAIDAEFQVSDQRYFLVACHACGSEQKLVFEQIKWDKRAEPRAPWGKHRPETARYECIKCGAAWHDVQRYAAIGHGHWKATAPYTGVAGFHLWQAYSTFVTAQRIVESFLIAKRKGLLAMQAWTNTVLGECWEEKSEGSEARVIQARAEDYDARVALPAGVAVITAGVDVQDDRLEVEVVGWGAGHESWSLEYLKVPGNLETGAPWGSLHQILVGRRYRHPSGVPLKIFGVCVDTGGNHTQAAYDYARGKAASGIWPIKGSSQENRPVIEPPGREKPSPRKRKSEVRPYMVGTDTAKDALHGALAVQEKGTSYCHFPSHHPAEYFEQLTAEKRRLVFSDGHPRRVWVLPAGRRNEVLDCRVYALAALRNLELLGLDLEKCSTELNAKVLATSTVIEPAAIVRRPPKAQFATTENQLTGRPRRRGRSLFAWRDDQS